MSAATFPIPSFDATRRAELHNARMLLDPIYFSKYYWPDVRFYAKQWDMIWAVETTPEVFVVAGNKLGKDFVSGFITLRYFLIHPVVRIITTSVKAEHLRVLWGEMLRYIQTSKFPLTADKDGMLIVNHMDIRKMSFVLNHEGRKVKERCPISYLWGMVSERGEGLAGHHAPHAMAVMDEASGCDDEAYKQMQGWAKRILAFGNPNTPKHGTSFFKDAVQKGDIIDTNMDMDGRSR